MRAAIAGIIVLCGLLAGTAAAEDSVTGAQLLKHLAGTWKAPDERTPRSTALDDQVFGPGAVDVRIVTLVISASGDATLQVQRSVVGSKGKVFAPSVTDVKMHIGEPVTKELGQLRPAVSVTSAEERYLDGDREHWTRDGSRVSLGLLDLTSRELNVQFDTPDGRGGFGATLVPASSSSAGTDHR